MPEHHDANTNGFIETSTDDDDDDPDQRDQRFLLSKKERREKRFNESVSIEVLIRKYCRLLIVLNRKLHDGMF
jgi:hypothetical protein